MLNNTKFIDAIKRMPKTIHSKSGKASYNNFHFKDKILYFTRVNTGKEWHVDVLLLHQIYKTNRYINTSVIRRIKNGRVNSPSIAILMAIKAIDNDGNRIN
jgi:hypothetical protein